MACLLYAGNFYTSRVALDVIAKMHHIGEPHLTPDGKAVLVFDGGGTTTMPNGPPVITKACLVPQSDGKHPIWKSDLVGLPENEERVRRIELYSSQLPDLEPLVEYDHLPETRKDYTVYKPGTKLI